MPLGATPGARQKPVPTPAAEEARVAQLVGMSTAWGMQVPTAVQPVGRSMPVSMTVRSLIRDQGVSALTGELERWGRARHPEEP